MKIPIGVPSADSKSFFQIARMRYRSRASILFRETFFRKRSNRNGIEKFFPSEFYPFAKTEAEKVESEFSKSPNSFFDSNEEPQNL